MIVPADQLACPEDWYAVPKAIRRAVWRAYLRSDQTAHDAAVTLAIRAMRQDTAT